MRWTRDGPQIQLVHGVFGSGKSFLLVVLIVFLTRLGNALGVPIRVLVSAATNTAVDRTSRMLFSFQPIFIFFSFFLPIHRTGSSSESLPQASCWASWTLVTLTLCASDHCVASQSPYCSILSIVSRVARDMGRTQMTWRRRVRLRNSKYDPSFCSSFLLVFRSAPLILPHLSL